MVFRRISTLTAAFAFAVSSAAGALAQDKPKDKPKEEVKLSKPQLEQLQTLSTLVDSVMAGKEPAPADAKLRVNAHFVKSTAAIFVPYLVEMTSGKFTALPVAVYVRAVSKSALALPEKPAITRLRTCISSMRKRFCRRAPTVPSSAAGSSCRLVISTLYIAMTETPARNSKTPPKRVVHTHSLTVPDFSTGLTTSSIILAKNLEDAPPQLTPQQQLEQPFTIGGNKITPTFTPTFSKAGGASICLFHLQPGRGRQRQAGSGCELSVLSSRRDQAFQQGRHDDVQRDDAPGGVQLKCRVISWSSARGSRSSSFAPGDYKARNHYRR